MDGSFYRFTLSIPAQENGNMPTVRVWMTESDFIMLHSYPIDIQRYKNMRFWFK